MSCAQVPGGGSTNNYGNVELVCRVALQERVQAVWAGWGHASENPRLPELLERNNVAFLGPSASAMQLLGAGYACERLRSSYSSYLALLFCTVLYCTVRGHAYCTVRVLAPINRIQQAFSSNTVNYEYHAKY